MRIHKMLFRCDDTIRDGLEANKQRDGIPYHEQIRRAVVAWLATRDLPPPPAPAADRQAAWAARVRRLTEAEAPQQERGETVKDGRIKPKAAQEQLSGRDLLARWIVRGRMNQAEAAERIGISRVKLNQYLNAAARPSLETAIRIEDASGIGIRSWLIDAPEAAEVSGGDGGASVAEGNGREAGSVVNIIADSGHKQGI